MRTLLKSSLLLVGLLPLLLSGQELKPRGITPDGTIFDMARKGHVLYVTGGFDRVGYYSGATALINPGEKRPELEFPRVKGDVYAVVPDGNGGWYIGGDFTEVGVVNRDNLAHILPNMQVDPAFAPDVNNSVNSLLIFNDTMMVGGRFTSIDNTPRSRLAAFDLTNNNLLPFDPAPNGVVNDLELHNGKLYIGGDFDRIADFDQPGLAVIDLATGQSEPVPSPGNGRVRDLLIFNDTMMIGGGFFGQFGLYSGSGALFKNNTDLPVYGFPAAKGNVECILPDGNGGWYLGGSFFKVGDSARQRLVHIFPDNSIDPNFNFTINGTVSDMAIFNDTMMLAGFFTIIDGQSRPRLAQIDLATNTLTSFNPGANNPVKSLLIDGSFVWAGGNFTRIADNAQARLALLHRQTGALVNIPGPANGEVTDIVKTGGKVIAGGSFTGASGYFTGQLAQFSGNNDLPDLDYLDLSGTVEHIIPDGNGGWFVGGGFSKVKDSTLRRLIHILPNGNLDPNFDVQPNNTVRALHIFNDTIMFAGNFTQVNGQPRGRMAAYHMGTNTLLPWNPDLNNTVFTITSWNDTMMIGGNFTTVGGVTRERIAGFDMGNNGSLISWNPGSTGTVYALAWNDTMMYAGGSFLNFGGQSRFRLAALERSTGQLASFNPGANGFVYDLHLDGGSLYIGGSFTQIDGQNRGRVAEIDLANYGLTPFNPDFNTTVQDINIFNDTIMVAGSFASVGGTPRNRLAAINQTTGALLPWAPEPNNTVNTVAVANGQIMVGGSFVNFKTENRNRLLALDATTFQIDPLDPSPNGTVDAILRDGTSNTVFFGGNFTNFAGQSRDRLAKFDVGTGVLDAWNPGADGRVRTMLAWNDTMMIGGNFGTLAGQAAGHLGAVNKTTGASLPWFLPEPDDEVLALAGGSGSFVSGGEFDLHRAATRNRLAGINLGSKATLDWAPSITGFGFPEVNALAWNDTMMYIGGRFSTIDGQSRSNFAAVSFNGNLSSFDPSPDGEVFTIWRDTIMYIGGEFQNIGGLPRGFGAAYDLTTGTLTSWNPRASWAIRTIQPGYGKYLLGGEFDMLNQVERDNAFAMDMRTGEVLPWYPSPGFLVGDGLEVDPDRDVVYLFGFGNQGQNVQAVDGTFGLPKQGWNLTFNLRVNEIKRHPRTGDLYFGGAFTQVNGQSRSHLAAVDTAGNLLPFAPDLDGEVWSMSWNDTMMFVAGDFTTVNNQPRNKLAAVNLDGDLLRWNPQTDVPSFSALSLVEAQSDRVYIGGSFNTVNGKPRRRLAAVDPKKGDLLPWNPRLKGKFFGFDLNMVRPMGEGVLLGGSLESVAGTPVEDLAYVGSVSGLVKEQFPLLGINSVFTSAFNDTMMIVGGDFRNLDSRFHPYLAFFKIASSSLSQNVESLSPEKGGNTGDVTLEVVGGGFRPGTKVYLTGGGFKDLYPYDSAMIIYSGVRIEATFNLRGVAPGPRDVVVEIPGDTTIVLPAAFEVLSGGEALPWAQAVIPALTTVNREEMFYISYGNSGVIDAHGVPIWFAISPEMEVLDIGLEIISVVDENDPLYDSIPEFVRIDTFLGKPYDAKVYGYIIPKVSAGDSKVITLKVKSSTLGKYRMRAWANEGMFGSPLKYWVGDCWDLYITTTLGLIPGVGCVAGVADAVLSPAFDAAYDPNFGSGSWAANYGLTLAGTAAGCLADATTGGLGRVVVESVDQTLKFKAGVDLLLKCFPPEDEEGEEGETVGSCDPNDKTGPTGNGGLGWLTTQRQFPYMIRFENDPAATAPAKEVIIRDTLDASVFDLSTVEVRGFTIADSFYSFPPARANDIRRVDLRPRLGFIVECEAELNPATSELTWTFTTLDTATLQPVTGPLEGFLPPNTDTLSGQGAVFFDVHVHDTITSGREIVNRAAIYFDFNAPIITNNWNLRADNDPPVSSVSALPDTQFTASFPVTWSGTDVGSGIRNYDVLFRVDGGNWRYLAVGSSATSLNFPAPEGGFYEFYSVAYDSALNREIVTGLPDATTFVAASVSIEDELAQSGVKVYPQPSSGWVTVEDEKLRPEARFVLRDLTGRELAKPVAQGFSEGKCRLDLSSMPAGLYLLEWRAGPDLRVVKLLME